MNYGSYLYSLLKEDGVRMNINNNIEMNTSSTRYLAADYLDYRLTKHGYNWVNRPPLEHNVNKIQRAMRTLADRFEENYRAAFDDMVQQLNITPDIAYPTFIAVAKELFIDGINWGRVVALFAFGGAIAIECIVRNMEHLVDSILEWVSQYIENHLQQWITSQGGWNGLAEFYEQSPENGEKGSWGSFGRICLGAVGVLALGAILTNKS